MLKREEILSKTALKTEIVPVPEWGGEVIVSEMSGTARDAWEQALRDKDAKGKVIAPRAKLVAFTVVDENGSRIFKDDDIEAIGKLSSESLGKICDVALRLNGLGEEGIEAATKN